VGMGIGMWEYIKTRISSPSVSRPSHQLSGYSRLLDFKGDL
jgi:hypothetical protein